jgi:hypothetical protein
VLCFSRNGQGGRKEKATEKEFGAVRETTLILNMSAEAAQEWKSALRRGFLVAIDGPEAVSSFLRDDLDLGTDYVRSRVATVFLDGKPVDDLEAARVCDGSVVALAGFMPGIAGITMRRNSPVAAMRCQISAGESNDVLPQEPGHVTVRLFNTVAEEIGPAILAKGFLLRGKYLAEFLASRSELFLRGLNSAELAGKGLDAGSLANLSEDDLPDVVRIEVRTESFSFPP